MYAPRPPSRPPAKKDTAKVDAQLVSDSDFEFSRDGSFKSAQKDSSEDKNKGTVEKVKNYFKKKLSVPKAHTRIMICALAVSLLWASSLLVCRLVVYSFVPRPTLSRVESRVTTMEAQVEAARVGYVASVDDKTQICRAAYELSNAEERERVNNVLRTNNDTLDIQQQAVSTCSNNQQFLVDAILGLNNRTENPLEFNETYFSQDASCVDVEEFFKRQLAARRATQAVQANDEAGKNAVSTLQDRLAARAAYDAEYLANLTGLSGVQFPGGLVGGFNTNLSFLNSCLTGGGSCSPNLAFLTNNMYANFSGTYNAIKTRAQGFADGVNGFKNTFVGVITAVSDAASSIGALQSDFSGFACCNLNALPWSADISLSSLTSGINAQLPIPDGSAIASAISSKVGQFGTSLTANIGSLTAIDLEMAQLQSDFALNIGSDYDPPDIGPALSLTVEGVSEEFASSLGFVTNSNVTKERNQVFSNASESAVNFLQSIDPREWELFAYGQDVFNQFRVGTDLFTNYALLFDAVYRILYSIMLIRKYWNISGIATPPADIRNDSHGIYKEKKNIFQLLGYILTHPLVNMLLIGIWVAIISFVLYFAYEPLYTQYVQGCVQNDAENIQQGTVEGTMIYRNLLSVTENYAFADGDNAIAEGIDTLNLEREFACRTDFDNSLDERTKQNQTYQDLVFKQENIIEMYNLFNSCIFWNVIDEDFGVSLRPVAETSECFIPFTEINLSDALLFDCAAVEPCIYVFDGSPEKSVRSVSHATACDTEFYMHAYLISWTFAIAMYILLNLARIYFMRGVIAIWWQRITIGRFSYLSSCTADGTPIDPPEVDKDGAKWENVVRDKLTVVLRRFERTGYFEIAYAVALQLPWILGLSILAPSLKFEA